MSFGHHVWCSLIGRNNHYISSYCFPCVVMFILIQDQIFHVEFAAVLFLMGIKLGVVMVVTSVFSYVSCDQFIMEAEYDYLVQNPSLDPWFCSNCIADQVSMSSQPPLVSSSGCKLWCLYFNAHSIYCKRLNMAAYLTAGDHELDVISITSPFWITLYPTHL